MDFKIRIIQPETLKLKFPNTQILDTGGEAIGVRMATVEDDTICFDFEIIMKYGQRIEYQPMTFGTEPVYSVNNETLSIKAFKSLSNEVLGVI